MAHNLLTGLPSALAEEQLDVLLQRPGLTLERIVSTGQATAPGEWLAQDQAEWVLLLAGSAGLTLEGEASLELRPGDWLLIPAGRRHRVDWTSSEEPTVWLALHLS
jgi:cupin 2 domain-containing protein